MIDELMERYSDFRDKHAKEKVKLGSYRSRQLEYFSHEVHIFLEWCMVSNPYGFVADYKYKMGLCHSENVNSQRHIRNELLHVALRSHMSILDGIMDTLLDNERMFDHTRLYLKLKDFVRYDLNEVLTMADFLTPIYYDSGMTLDEAKKAVIAENVDEYTIVLTYNGLHDVDDRCRLAAFRLAHIINKHSEGRDWIIEDQLDQPYKDSVLSNEERCYYRQIVDNIDEFLNIFESIVKTEESLPDAEQILKELDILLNEHRPILEKTGDYGRFSEIVRNDLTKIRDTAASKDYYKSEVLDMCDEARKKFKF